MCILIGEGTAAGIAVSGVSKGRRIALVLMFRLASLSGTDL